MLRYACVLEGEIISPDEMKQRAVHLLSKAIYDEQFRTRLQRLLDFVYYPILFSAMLIHRDPYTLMQKEGGFLDSYDPNYNYLDMEQGNRNEVMLMENIETAKSRGQGWDDIDDSIRDLVHQRIQAYRFFSELKVTNSTCWPNQSQTIFADPYYHEFLSDNEANLYLLTTVSNNSRSPEIVDAVLLESIMLHIDDKDEEGQPSWRILKPMSLPQKIAFIDHYFFENNYLTLKE